MKLTINPLALPVRNPDDTLTAHGKALVQSYAKAWLAGTRETATELAYPDIAGVLYDVRTDVVLAQNWAH